MFGEYRLSYRSDNQQCTGQVTHTFKLRRYIWNIQACSVLLCSFGVWTLTTIILRDEPSATSFARPTAVCEHDDVCIFSINCTEAY